MSYTLWLGLAVLIAVVIWIFVPEPHKHRCRCCHRWWKCRDKNCDELVHKTCPDCNDWRPFLTACWGL